MTAHINAEIILIRTECFANILFDELSMELQRVSLFYNKKTETFMRRALCGKPLALLTISSHSHLKPRGLSSNTLLLAMPLIYFPLPISAATKSG